LSIGQLLFALTSGVCSYVREESLKELWIVEIVQGFSVLVKWTSYEPTIYGSYGIRAQVENVLGETCMVSTHSDYRRSGQELFPRPSEK
jgi:hypothetical protein